MQGLVKDSADLLDFPSWVPDWQTPSGKVASSLNGSLYTVATESSTDLNEAPAVSPDGRSLRAWGVLYDVISDLVEPGWDVHVQVQDPYCMRLPFNGHSKIYPTGASMLEVFLRTVNADVDVVNGRTTKRLKEGPDGIIGLIAAFLKRSLHLWCVAHDRTAGDDTYNHLMGLLVEQQELPEDLFDDLGFAQFMASLDERQVSLLGERLRAVVLENPEDAMVTIYYASYHRCLVETRKAYIGLTPVGTRVGDCVCVLFGAEFPMIMRPVEDHFVLIGEAFIHGVMNGEVMAELRDSKVAKRAFDIYHEQRMKEPQTCPGTLQEKRRDQTHHPVMDSKTH